MTGDSRQVKAVLFDMDGVVTDTATAHSAAWQKLFDDFLAARAKRNGTRFEPFDPEADYRRYVDGKPRSDGVQSFLDARGIGLPLGGTDDGPDQETVRGLGARKDGYFRQWLDTHQVHSWPGTLALIDQLRRAGIPIAVFSSSRNAGQVLQSAGLAGAFAARVDGNDLALLGISGKPDPAMLLEAAKRIEADPAHTAVIEDAVAGVQAGVRGGFEPVIGVSRSGDGSDLVAAGADSIVEDLAELTLNAERRLIVKTLATLPPLQDQASEFEQLLAGRAPVVFLDYDGTLSPIVEDHTKAVLADDMRAAIEQLSNRCPVAVVSGRDLAMLQQLVALDSIIYAGSHGFEIAGPKSGVGAGLALERGSEFLPELDAADRSLREALGSIDGHAIERKRFSIAVHFRNVAEGDVSAVRDSVEVVLSRSPRLRLGHGKKVFEIQPKLDWNKGRAVLWALEQLDLARADVLPIYIGDDITDESAFRALAGYGIGIAVRDGETRRSAADFSLRDTGDVKAFLQRLASMTEAVPGQR